MLYNININQKSIVENGFSVKANHIAVLEAISSYILSNKAYKLSDPSGDWYWVSYELIISQTPMFDISKHRCRQLISELCDNEILERHPENEKLARVYLRLGRKFDLYKSFDPANNLTEGVQKRTGSCQKNSRVPANKLAPPCQKISRDNNTNNNSTKDKDNIGDKSPSTSSASIDPVEKCRKKKKAFADSLVPFVDTYSREMIRSFYDYWSETNISNTKMRWEMEKTWNLNLRLKRWQKNDKSKPLKGSVPTKPLSEDPELAAQRAAARGQSFLEESKALNSKIDYNAPK